VRGRPEGLRYTFVAADVPAVAQALRPAVVRARSAGLEACRHTCRSAGLQACCIHYRVDQRWRREDAFIARLRDTIAHRLVFLGRAQPLIDVIDGKCLTHERRRLGRKRLRRPRLLTRHITLRHGLFLDRPEWFSGDAIERVQKTGLPRVGDGRHSPALVSHRHELRGRSVVEVPQIVMDRLEVPQPLPRARVECQQAVGEEILAVAIRAIEIVRSRPGRDVDDAARVVD
jgi:hypothetical protein